MKKEIRYRCKGFTMVQIIVVLVILVILAAALIPALTGYIDKAKNQKYVNITRDFVMAAQGGMVEAYALYSDGFDLADDTGAVRKNNNPKIANGKRYGWITNWYGKNSYEGTKFDLSKASTYRGDKFKKAVCNSLGDYLEYKHLKMANAGPGANDKASKYKDECAFVLVFDERAKVVFVQFAYEGEMVTFDGNSYVVEDDGTFLSYSN